MELFIAGLLMYMCTDVVSAIVVNKGSHSITDITTLNIPADIPTSTTWLGLQDNNIGANGIPQTYFSVSSQYLFEMFEINANVKHIFC